MAWIFDFGVTENTSAVTGFTAELPEHDTNDMLICFAAKDSTGAITYTAGTGWTALSSGAGGAQWVGAWYKRATSNSESAPAFTHTSDESNAIVVAVRGSHTSTNPTSVISTDDNTMTGGGYLQDQTYTSPSTNSIVLFGMGTDSGMGPAPMPGYGQILYAGDAGTCSCGVGYQFFKASGVDVDNYRMFGVVGDNMRIITVGVPDNGSNTYEPPRVDLGSTFQTLYGGVFSGATVTSHDTTWTAAASNSITMLGSDWDKVWTATGAGPTWTDETTDTNDDGAGDVALGNTATNAIYWGSSTTFTSICVDVGTAGVGTPTVVWEYSTGSGAWSTLSFTTVIGVSSWSSNFTVAGAGVIRFTAPATWAKDTVNGEGAPGFYYIRQRLSVAWPTSAPTLDQSLKDGRPITYDSSSSVADTGTNPYWGALGTTPATTNALQANRPGGEYVATAAQNLSSGYYLTQFRYTGARDIVDVGYFDKHKGVTLTLMDTNAENRRTSWMISARDAADASGHFARVIGIQPSQTVDTALWRHGTLDTTIVDTWILNGGSPFGALSATISMWVKAGECWLAGGTPTEIMGIEEAIEGLIKGTSYFPLMEQSGVIIDVWYPVRWGGGEVMHFTEDLKYFKFPSRASLTSKTNQWHVDDNQVGFDFSPTVKTFLGNTYSKSFNANTAGFANEGTDWNSAGANDVALPPIQDTTTGDIIYFGSDRKFANLRLNIGTAGAYSGYTLQWQYYNGAWTALSGVTDGTNYFQTSGTNNVSWTAPTDWTTTTIDSQAAYWVRCIVTVMGTTSTPPLGTQGWIDGDTLKMTNCTFVGETPYYWRWNANASAGATIDFTGCSLYGATVTLRSVTTFTTMLFYNCSEITLNGATVTSSTITNSRATTSQGAVAITSASEGSSVTNITFTDNNDGDIGHSIRITATGTYTFSNYTFTGGGPTHFSFHTQTDVDAGDDEIDHTAHGYSTGDAIYYQDQGGTDTIGLTDGNMYYVRAISANALAFYPTKADAQADTNQVGLTDGSGGETHYIYSAKADVFNNSGSAVTINITNSTDIPTIRNSNGSSTNVILAVSVGLTVLDEDNAAIQNVQVYFQKSATGKNWNYTSDSGNSAGDADFIVNETVDLDIPQTGWIHVWDASSNTKQNYRYASWASKTFTLNTEVTGTADDGGSSATNLVDSAGNFTTVDIEEGDTIRNTTDGSWAVVDEIVSATQLTTSALTGGGNTWEAGDTYSLHKLALTYTDGEDLADIPIFNGQTDSNGEVSTTYNYSAYSTNLPVLIRVRSNTGATKYVPYTTSGTITSDGFSGTVVLTEDTVAT